MFLTRTLFHTKSSQDIFRSTKPTETKLAEFRSENTLKYITENNSRPTFLSVCSLSIVNCHISHYTCQEVKYLEWKASRQEIKKTR